METILLTGGNGLVGKALSPRLAEKGYGVIVLSRRPDPDSLYRNYFWDPSRNIIDETAVQEADFMVSLAGENLGEKRWTKRRRQEILDSRVKTSELLFNTFIRKGKKLRAFISASAIGFYGAVTSDRIFTEADPPGNDFAAEVCMQWEGQAAKFVREGIRTVILRSGIVLAPKDGVLERMALVSKLGIGSPIGSGKQYLPWIHIGDLCNIYIKAIEDPNLKGAYNAVAPDHKTNREFTGTLAKILRNPYFAPAVPEFVMKMLFGEMALMLLRGSRISPQKVIDAGYTFRFPVLEDALADTLKKK